MTDRTKANLVVTRSVFVALACMALASSCEAVSSARDRVFGTHRELAPGPGPSGAPSDESAGKPASTPARSEAAANDKSPEPTVDDAIAVQKPSASAGAKAKPEPIRIARLVPPPPVEKSAQPESSRAEAKPAHRAHANDEAAGVEGGVTGGVQGGMIGGVVGGVVADGAANKDPSVEESEATAVMDAPKSPVADRKKTDLRSRDEADRSEGVDGNRFSRMAPNPFTRTKDDALSTFSVDVDTASYSLARRYLRMGALPPPGAVRVEEFVNYFKYHDAPPETGAFSVSLEGAPSPFNSAHHLLRVGVQGKLVARSMRKPAHLVFLVDTSGSMQSEDRLPLAKEAMKIAIKNLGESDTVALVTYAGGVRDVLPPTPATDQQTLFQAIDGLRSGGGTAMGSGMELAYRHAVQKASGGVVSRVIVLTDGDTNIGRNLTASAMLESVQKYVAEGVTLTTVGFGMGNYRDDLMEKLADKGNGNCFYIDSLREAKKVFETQLTGTLEVIAKDVKLQVEFDPKVVSEYRLIGYENRDIADRDFRNDKVDAGEIGAGHSVTAMYEVKLTGAAGALGTVRIRAKEPSGTQAKEQAFPIQRAFVKPAFAQASADLRFATAVAATADILRDSSAAAGWSLAKAEKIAEEAQDGTAERKEFVALVGRAQKLWESQHRVATGR